jgi:iron uptake system component EfeO
MLLFRPAIAAVGLAIAVSASGCGSSGSGSGEQTYDVRAGDKTCDVEKTRLPAGVVVFKVENTGSDVTEVYVYGQQAGEFTRIVGEVENIGPGTSRDFTVSLPRGAYQVACKPGMTGDGIRTNLTVTGPGGSGSSNGESSESYDREMEFSVSAAGGVEPPSGGLRAARGQRIEFKLHNASGEEHYLKVVDPQGHQVGTAEADAGAEAEFVAELPSVGDYTVSVYAKGAEGSATSTPLTVTRNTAQQE